MRNTTRTKRVWDVLGPWPFWLIFLLQRTDSQGQGCGSWSLCPIYTPQGHVLVSLLHQGLDRILDQVTQSKIHQFIQWARDIVCWGPSSFEA